MNLNRCWLLACCLAFAGLPTQAAPNPAALAPVLSELRQADLLRGAWAVQRGDAAPIAGQIGPALADGQLAHSQTRYRMGSISKLVTAVLVMQLVEQGQLRLDQPVAPLFDNAEALAGVTVEHLLRHRSGLGDVKNAPDFNTWARQARSLTDMRALVLGLPREFPPGARAAYNNSGYLILHALLEKVGGAPYAEQLRQRITAPLALPSLMLAQPGQENSESFNWEGAAWQPSPATDPSVPLGAGALVATPSDLTKFIRALFTHRLLKAETLAQMTKLQEGFGLGLYAVPKAGALVLQGWGHEGQIDGYQSVLVYLPAQQLAVAVLLNAQRWPRDALLDELIRWASSDAYRAIDLRPRTARWTLTFQTDGLALPQGSRLALRGSQSPLSWQRGLPLQRQPNGQYTTQLQWQGRLGLPLEAKFVIEDRKGQVIRWEKTANRRWLIDQAPGPMRFDLDPEGEALRAAVLAVDERLSSAINERDLTAITALLSPKLEFFHDKGGLSDFAANVEQFRQNFARTQQQGGHTTRNLIPEGLQIYPVPGVGAMQIGRHRFCFVPNQGGQSQCQDLGFSHVWERDEQGAFRLLRVLSYGH